MFIEKSVHSIDDSKRKPLFDLCKHTGLSTIVHTSTFIKYLFIVEGLELIGYGMRNEQHKHLCRDWDTGSKSEAQQILSSITKFYFIVVLYLSQPSGITLQLQSRTLDIEAHNMIGDIKDVQQRVHPRKMELKSLIKPYFTSYNYC